MQKKPINFEYINGYSVRKKGNVAYLGLSLSIFQKSLWWCLFKGDLKTQKNYVAKTKAKKKNQENKKPQKPKPQSKLINLILSISGGWINNFIKNVWDHQGDLN